MIHKIGMIINIFVLVERDYESYSGFKAARRVANPKQTTRSSS
jgi:hypothetical protein